MGHHPAKHPLVLGYLALVMAQVGISVNVVISKHLLNFIPMFGLVSCRFLITTILLGLIMLATKTTITDPQHPTQKLTQQDWLFTIMLGLFGAVFFNLLFIWGLRLTTATAAGIVSSVLPALIALFAIWFLQEKLNLAKVLALFLSILGILIINVDSSEAKSFTSHSYLGDFLVFLAMVPEAIYSILSRKVAGRITPIGGAFMACLVGFLGLLPFALYNNGLDLSFYTSHNMLLISSAAAASLLFFWGWAWGLSFIPASTCGIFAGVMPVTTSLLAIYFLDELLSWHDLAGIVLVLGAILISTGWQPAFFSKKKLCIQANSPVSK